MSEEWANALRDPHFMATLERAHLSITISNYCRLITKNDPDAQWRVENSVANSMKNPLMPVESIEALLTLVLDEIDREGKKGRLDTVAVAALHRTDCPVDLLTRASRCKKAEYREAAMANPNCPEEDRVYAALLNESTS